MDIHIDMVIVTYFVHTIFFATFTFNDTKRNYYRYAVKVCIDHTKLVSDPVTTGNAVAQKNITCSATEEPYGDK